MTSPWPYQRSDLMREAVRWQEASRVNYLAAEIEMAVGNLDVAARFQRYARHASAAAREYLFQLLGVAP